MRIINIKQKIKNSLKNPIFWARFLGYTIPLIFFLYILYLNFLPFGYNKTFIINIGAENDTRVGEFYLEPSPDLSDRKIDENGNSYRELNGMANLVFKPRAVLKDAEITIEVKDEGIFIIPLYLNIDSIDWDYDWDFAKGIPEELKNKNNKVFYIDENTYFDGTARLEFPDSSDMFENRAFTIYAEWIPMDDENNSQQIVGHYNWELWQNKNEVKFSVGRMNNGEGPFYSIKYKIKDAEEFFSKKHTAMAIYNPSNINGYIELFVDNKFVERKYLGPDKIWEDYSNNNLSIGWTPHDYQKNPYFKGIIKKIKVIDKNISQKFSKMNFQITENITKIIIPIITQGTYTLSTIKLNAIKK